MSEQRSSVVINMYPNPDSEAGKEFYRWLGICVTGWAFVDRRLYQIFHHATGVAQKQSALFYYRNRAFNQRLRLVDEAVKMALSEKDLQDKWKPLHNRALDLSHTRNIFAHQPTLRTGTTEEGKSVDIYTIYIEPYERILNNDYPGLRGKTALGTEDFKEHNRDTERLESDLHAFANFMGQRRS